MMNPVGDAYVNRRCVGVSRPVVQLDIMAKGWRIPYDARYSDFATVLQIDMKPFPFASDGTGHSAVLS